MIPQINQFNTNIAGAYSAVLPIPAYDIFGNSLLRGVPSF